MEEITVVGAGVVGLSAAIKLSEAGFKVTLVSEKFTPETTSDAAAAFWCPFLSAPLDRVAVWAEDTYTELADHVSSQSGVSLFRLQKRMRDSSNLWWTTFVNNCEFLDDVPEGFRYVTEFDSYLMESKFYMPYLMHLFSDLAGEVVQKRINDISQIETSLIVNATGLGSYELFGDTELFPIRGQVVLIEKPDQDIGVVDGGLELPLCIIPRSTDIVLGVSVVENNWSVEESEKETESILDRCAKVSPQIRNQKVQGVKVGLRPGRSSVKLESADMGNKKIIHCYGHGGSGYTLSWGCANEVTQIAKSFTQSS